MVLFPHLDDITLGRISTTIPRITIFLQDKLITSCQPLGNHPIKNNIPIDLYTYFAVSVSWYLVKLQFRFEIPPNYRPNVVPFDNFVVVVVLLYVVDAIRAISLPAFANNPDLTSGSSPKINLI